MRMSIINENIIGWKHDFMLDIKKTHLEILSAKPMSSQDLTLTMPCLKCSSKLCCPTCEAAKFESILNLDNFNINPILLSSNISSKAKQIIAHGCPTCQMDWEVSVRHCLCLGFSKPVNVLTHWGWNKMADILQTPFWNVFSWVKMFDFRLKFHWMLLLRVQLTISQHWFR